jgi:sn-glycerol 3-phosphate transport system permease protein
LRKKTGTGLSIVPYLYVLPALVIFIAFTYWPMIYSFYLSFHDWNFIRPDKQFIGLFFYRDMFQRGEFWTALLNTGKYLAGMIPFVVFFPLVLSFLLGICGKNKARSVYRTLAFFPSVLSFTVVSIIWIWLLNPTGGLVNRLLALAGIAGPAWLSNPQWALWSIVFISGWKVFGYNLVLFLAAFESVPASYLEAAVLDGANNWQRFWYIELPMVSPTTFFILTTAVIFSVTDVFVPINVLTQGGPFHSTTNLTYMIYETGFQYFNIGLASTVATFTFLLFVAITCFQVKFGEKGVHYGS